MARKPKSTAEPAKSSAFLEALKFAALITRDIGPINETHVMLNKGWCTVFNGVMACGHKIEEDLHACPQNKLMVEALSKCGQNLSITQLDNNRLSIKSDKFKAIVPCVEQYLLQQAHPDPPVATIDNRFKEAIQIISGLKSEDGQSVTYCSALMNGYSLVASIGTVIFEAWHGIHLPSAIALPKAIISTLIKVNKNFAKFGFSNSSVTFYFDNESWIKTQTYAEPWPDLAPLWSQPDNAYPLPPDFYTGVGAVGPFTSDGNVYFGREVLQSHLDASTGAIFEMPGLPAGPIYPVKQLQLIKPYVETADFLAPGPGNTRMLKFYGSNMRGYYSRTKAMMDKDRNII